MSKSFIAALVPALLIAGTAAAQTTGPTPSPKSGEQADIVFATNGGIRTFTPELDGDGVYLQDRRKNWYYASFAGRCNELPYTMQVGFKTFGGSSTLSRGDTIIAGREQCRIMDLVHSGPPPEKKKRKKKAA